MSRFVKLKRKPTRQDFLQKPSYRVKLFGHNGVYPRGTYCTPTGLFHADPEIAFAVTHGPSWRQVSDVLPYSEADWLQPELVRLMGALLFTEQFPEGRRCWFYPHAYDDFFLNEEKLDLHDQRTALAVKRSLLRTVGNRLWPKHTADLWDAYLGHDFHLFDGRELSVEAFELYWKSISTTNFLLLRGIQSLVKSDMLATHPEFLEEASIAAFIALDASFQLVLRHLRTLGMLNPSAKDAGAWLSRTFDEPLGIDGGKDFKYYEEFYEQRVQTVHPNSRYGDIPIAPVSRSDRIHLRQALPGVFAYLSLGDHSPHFYEKLRDHASRVHRPR